VLVVEDEPQLASLYAAYLEREGVVPQQVESGAAALAATADRAFDVVLLDIYDWPGNIRQLQNVMRSIVVLNAGGIVEASMLPAMLGRRSGASPQQGETRAASPAEEGDDVLPLWIIEKRAIEHAIALCEGNVPKAAELLRISPSTIYRKRQAWAAGEEG
jgi:two-component system repressor protein LuxO